MVHGQVDLLAMKCSCHSWVKTFFFIRTFAEDLEPQWECEEQHHYSRRGVAAAVCFGPWYYAAL